MWFRLKVAMFVCFPVGLFVLSNRQGGEIKISTYVRAVIKCYICRVIDNLFKYQARELSLVSKQVES